MPTSR